MKRILLLFTIMGSQLCALDSVNLAAKQRNNAEDVVNDDTLSDECLTAIQDYKNKFVSEEEKKTKIKYKSMDSCLKQEIINAFKKFNITDPFVLLQCSEHRSSCHGYELYLERPIYFIIIAIDDISSVSSVARERFALYHEIGHYLNRDSYHWYHNHIIEKGLDVGTAFLMMVPSIALYYKLSSPVISPIPNALISNIVGGAVFMPVFLSKIGSTIVRNFFFRKREAAADLFAIKALLAQNDLEALFSWFLWLTEQLDKGNSSGSTNVGRYMDCHPNNYERAAFVLKELKKAKVDLKSIPFSRNELDKVLAQHKINEQITKYFPEFA